KGAPDRTAAPEEAGACWSGGNGGIVADHCPDVRLGLAGCPHPGRRGPEPGGGGAAAVGWSVRSRGAAWRSAGPVGGGGSALRAGQPQLLAGPVPLLRSSRPAADQQRPGALVRQSPLPRATCQRSQGGLTVLRVTGTGSPVGG